MQPIVRRMTPGEVVAWQHAMAEHYAQDQIRLGRWARDGAHERALRGITAQLPQGADTPRMLVLTAEDDGGRPIGRAWVGLDHPSGVPDTAYLHNIEIDESRRGQGLGTALLAAIERATSEAGVGHLELHVFTGNRAAMSLYAGAGYEATEQTMRKAIPPRDEPQS